MCSTRLELSRASGVCSMLTMIDTTFPIAASACAPKLGPYFCLIVGCRTNRPLLIFPRCKEMRSSSFILERPMCPTCKHRMGLARISPGERGFEQRTFECSTCDHIKALSLPVDPLQTDAVGWLAGELKPPR